MDMNDFLEYLDKQRTLKELEKKWAPDLKAAAERQWKLMEDAYNETFPGNDKDYHSHPRWVNFANRLEVNGTCAALIENGCRGNSDEEVMWFTIDPLMFNGPEYESVIKARYLREFQDQKKEKDREKAEFESREKERRRQKFEALKKEFE